MRKKNKNWCIAIVKTKIEANAYVKGIYQRGLLWGRIPISSRTRSPRFRMLADSLFQKLRSAGFIVEIVSGSNGAKLIKITRMGEYDG